MTERREPAQFLFLVARNGNAIGHFAHPECLNCEGAVGCVVGERESNSLSLSLSRKISNFIPRREMKEEEEEEEKEREKGRKVFRIGRLFELKRIKGGKKFRESIRIGSIRGESIRLESPKISIRGRKRIYPDRKSLTSHESRFVSWIDLAEKVDGIDLTNFINVCRSLSVSRARNTRAERGGGGGGEGDPLAAESR